MSGKEGILIITQVNGMGDLRGLQKKSDVPTVEGARHPSGVSWETGEDEEVNRENHYLGAISPPALNGKA